jgi:hypothetical protein
MSTGKCIESIRTPYYFIGKIPPFMEVWEVVERFSLVVE